MSITRMTNTAPVRNTVHPKYRCAVAARAGRSTGSPAMTHRLHQLHRIREREPLLLHQPHDSGRGEVDGFLLLTAPAARAAVADARGAADHHPARRLVQGVPAPLHRLYRARCLYRGL